MPWRAKPQPPFGCSGQRDRLALRHSLQGNVIAAGVPRVESKLHRHLARVGGDLRGPSSFDGDRPKRSAYGRAAKPPSAGRAWTACGRPAERVDNATARCPHSPTACPPPPRIAASPGSTRPSGLTRFACQDLYLISKSNKATPKPAFRHRERPTCGAPLRNQSAGELRFNARPNNKRRPGHFGAMSSRALMSLMGRQQAVTSSTLGSLAHWCTAPPRRPHISRHRIDRLK